MRSQSPTARSAADLKGRLDRLEAEAAAAGLVGGRLGGAYWDALRTDLRAARSAYVGAAVTELATLRAALGAPLRG